MNTLEIEEILETKRLKLKGKEKLIHYLPVCLFLTVPLVDLFYLFETKINEDINGYQRVIDGFNLVWVSLVIALLVLIFKFLSLKFKVIESDIDFDKFKQAIALTVKELNWNIKSQNKEYVIATVNSGFFGYGERVTIIKFEKFILINSICDPQSKAAIFSQGGNEKNIWIFTRNVKSLSITAVTKNC